MDDGDWTFVIPVDALYLTEAVGREFRIDRVTFIDRDKLPRVRRMKRERLGLGIPVSELKKYPSTGFAPKVGSIPSSCMAWTRQQMLWQSTLHSASLTCPVSLFDLTESPNLPLIIENADSTLLLLR